MSRAGVGEGSCAVHGLLARIDLEPGLEVACRVGDIEFDPAHGVDYRCEAPEVDLEVMVNGHAELIDDRLGEQLRTAKGVGGVYPVGALTGNVHLEVARQAEQLATPVGYMGEDDHVGTGAAEVTEVPLQIVGKVLTAVGSDDQVVGRSSRRRQGVHGHAIHGELVEIDVAGSGKDGNNCQEQEEEHPPPAPPATPTHRLAGWWAGGDWFSVGSTCP